MTVLVLLWRSQTQHYVAQLEPIFFQAELDLKDLTMLNGGGYFGDGSCFQIKDAVVIWTINLTGIGDHHAEKASGLDCIRWLAGKDIS